MSSGYTAEELATAIQTMSESYGFVYDTASTANTSLDALSYDPDLEDWLANTPKAVMVEAVVLAVREDLRDGSPPAYMIAEKTAEKVHDRLSYRRHIRRGAVGGNA